MLFFVDFHGHSAARGVRVLHGSSMYLFLTQMDKICLILATAHKNDTKEKVKKPMVGKYEWEVSQAGALTCQGCANRARPAVRRNISIRKSVGAWFERPVNNV